MVVSGLSKRIEMEVLMKFIIALNYVLFNAMMVAFIIHQSNYRIFSKILKINVSLFIYLKRSILHYNFQWFLKNKS